MREIRRRLSWVDFLAPLSDDELDDLLRRASFVRLEEGEVLVVGPEEQAERFDQAVTLAPLSLTLEQGGRQLLYWYLIPAKGASWLLEGTKRRTGSWREASASAWGVRT
jgi:hypothetical protein